MRQVMRVGRRGKYSIIRPIRFYNPDNTIICNLFVAGAIPERANKRSNLTWKDNHVDVSYGMNRAATDEFRHQTDKHNKSQYVVSRVADNRATGADTKAFPPALQRTTRVAPPVLEIQQVVMDRPPVDLSLELNEQGFTGFGTLKSPNKTAEAILNTVFRRFIVAGRWLQISAQQWQDKSGIEKCLSSNLYKEQDTC